MEDTQEDEQPDGVQGQEQGNHGDANSARRCIPCCQVRWCSKPDQGPVMVERLYLRMPLPAPVRQPQTSLQVL